MRGRNQSISPFLFYTLTDDRFHSLPTTIVVVDKGSFFAGEHVGGGCTKQPGCLLYLPKSSSKIIIYCILFALFNLKILTPKFVSFRCDVGSSMG